MEGEYWGDIPIECERCNEPFHPDIVDEGRFLCYDCHPQIWVPALDNPVVGVQR